MTATRSNGRKAGVLVLLGVLVAVLMVGCGGDSSSSTADDSGSSGSAATDGGTIGFLSPLPDPWAKNMGKAVGLQAEELGLDVKTLEANYDPNLQLQGLDSLIQSQVDAIVALPIDVEALVPGIDRAFDAGIPYAQTYGYGLEDKEKVSFDLVSNEKEMAEEVGVLAAEEAGPDCAAAIMAGAPGVSVLEEREKGLRLGLEEGGCEILAEQHNADGSLEKATEIAEAWRTQFGSELKVIAGTDDANAEGSLVVREGDFQPLLTGFNGEETAVKLVESGELLATASQSTVQLGNILGYGAVMLIKGEEVPKEVTFSGRVLTADNSDEFMTEEELLAAGPMDVELVEEDGRWVAKVSLPE